MSYVAFLGAIEFGLIYGLVALGVYLSFRVLSFPDLTVDGSFPLGAAVAATAITGGLDPWLGTALAVAAGALAGLVTALLNVRFRILHLLASILTMIALYSIILRVMGRPNIALLGETTVLTPFEASGLPLALVRPLCLAVVVAVCAALLVRFLRSEVGLAMRATGANPRMAEAQGIAVGAMTCLGMALSNGLVALAGALFAQANGFADVTLGTGTIVVGLAAVIIGETLLPRPTVLAAVAGCVLGSVFYRIVVAFALEADFLGPAGVRPQPGHGADRGGSADPAGDPREAAGAAGAGAGDRARPDRGDVPPRHGAGDARPARHRPRHPARPVRLRDRQQRRRQVDPAQRAGRHGAGDGRPDRDRRHRRDAARRRRRGRGCSRACSRTRWPAPAPSSRSRRTWPWPRRAGGAGAWRWRWPTPAGHAGASGWRRWAWASRAASATGWGCSRAGSGRRWRC